MKKKYFWMIMISYTSVVAVIIAGTFTEVSPHREFAAIGISSIILFSLIAAKLMIKKSIMLLMFMFFVFFNVQYNSMLLAHATIDFHVFPRLISYQYGDCILMSLLYCAVAFPILYYLLVKLYKRIVDENIGTKQRDLFFCLPAGFYVSLSMLMRLNYQTGIQATKETFFPLLLVNLCEFISYYALLKAIVASYDAIAEQEKLHEVRSQLTLWEAQYESLQEQINSEARIRHDWRHHIITVLGFVEHKDLGGLDAYLADYKEKYLVQEAPPVCDVTALNMMFQYYQRKAVEWKVDMSISTVLFDQCLIPVSELTVVFGNLLENAIEACKRMEEGQKTVTLKIRNNDNKYIALICENSYDGILKKNGEKLASRKKKGGIGLTSVENIAKKYDGSMNVKTDGEKFQVYVVLRPDHI
ncbi:MAG: ATP-binding protein [Lachnospiraceae bacterium]